MLIDPVKHVSLSIPDAGDMVGVPLLATTGGVPYVTITPAIAAIRAVRPWSLTSDALEYAVLRARALYVQSTFTQIQNPVLAQLQVETARARGGLNCVYDTQTAEFVPQVSQTLAGVGTAGIAEALILLRDNPIVQENRRFEASGNVIIHPNIVQAAGSIITVTCTLIAEVISDEDFPLMSRRGFPDPHDSLRRIL